eukprot:gene22119-29179_t
MTLLNKTRSLHKDIRPDKSSKFDDDGESLESFRQGPGVYKPQVKYAWSANEKVNHESFHRMLDEYREAKRREHELELKTRQLTAQLARTEEAAKRALIQSDATARGGAAGRLLEAERALQKLRDENSELRNKLAREKKRSQDFKLAHDDNKKRLDQVLRDQRMAIKKVGDLEKKNGQLTRKPEDEYWGEEAGRRFAVQQEELVVLRDENVNLQKQIAALEESTGGPGIDTDHYESQIQEMQGLIKFYERKISGLAEQQIIAPQDDVAGGPTSGDWILEEHFHNDEAYLLDRKTSKLYTNPGQDSWPRPVGVRMGKDIKLGTANKMERFISTLDHYLQTQGERLQEVFNEFDLDRSGQLDRRELGRMIQKLMPDADGRDVDELRTMLDMDGDGLITFQEMLDTIKESFAARAAAKGGKSIQVNDALERIRQTFRGNRKLMLEAFDVMDTDHDGCLLHLEVVQLTKRFLPDLYQKEIRFLLAKLQEWDIAGEGKISFDELYQALELATIYRVNQGMGARAMSPTRGRQMGGMGGVSFKSPGRESMATLKVDRQSGAHGLKEGFLRERLMQLEAEIKASHRKEETLEADAKQGNMELASGDEKLHQAWETASQFKKRYLEHKGELDTIRMTYARMQAQLDETHKLLHEEHRKRFRLEDDNTRLNMELGRVKDLEARLLTERTERVKLEREYLTLQNKALSAPGQALAELRQLREEVFALRREKALAEQKEVEVRRELGAVREQLDGMSPEQYRTWQVEHSELRKKVVTLELELQAALDKLEVYRRTEAPGISDVLLGGADREQGLFGDRRPDADKNEEELRRELAQLRDVWRLDQSEITKLLAVLENESNQTLEAKSALEEAHREMDRIRRDLQDQLRGVQRELDRRDERIRKLELQLRGAYSGINNALRSNLRSSSFTADPDDFSEIGEDQNIFELQITEATLFEEVLGKDPSTFFTFDFFMHETQATPVVASNLPQYNTVVQYVLDQDPFMVEYLDTHVMELELNRARGWDYDTLGVARIPLRQVLEDVEIGAGLGHNRAYHYADVYGADGKRVGRVRYGFSFRKPLDSLIKQYRLFARSKRPTEPDVRDPAFQAVQAAEVQPKAASHIKVVVARCETLVPPSGGSSCRPYIHYRFPGQRDPHTTKTMDGLSPVFNDEANWLIARTPDIEANFKTREMEFVVFDDSGGDDPLRCIIGTAFVPLAALAQGMPVEAVFRLVNPVSKKPAGKIVIGMGWHNPLQLPGEAAVRDVELRNQLYASGAIEAPRQQWGGSAADTSLRDYGRPMGQGPGMLPMDPGQPFGLGQDVRDQGMRPPHASGGLGYQDALPSRSSLGGGGYGLQAEQQGGMGRPRDTGAMSAGGFGLVSDIDGQAGRPSQDPYDRQGSAGRSQQDPRSDAGYGLVGEVIHREVRGGDQNLGRGAQMAPPRNELGGRPGESFGLVSESRPLGGASDKQREYRDSRGGLAPEPSFGGNDQYGLAGAPTRQGGVGAGMVNDSYDRTGGVGVQRPIGTGVEMGGGFGLAAATAAGPQGSRRYEGVNQSMSPPYDR